MSVFSYRYRLLGRSGECALLDQLVNGVRSKESQVLVVRGEAGIGKTAMLDYLAERASECRIIRASGNESEVELAFAVLHQICAPLLGRLSRLPDPQRDALSTAFGMKAGVTPDRFLIGLAVLNLLSDASEDQPLICIVDDIQWVDRASAQILTFVARRFLAEPVAMVFALRETGHETLFSGLPTLHLQGLKDHDARKLLELATPGRLDKRVRDRIVADSRGNPLALLELPRSLTSSELAGGFVLPDAVPLSSRIELEYVLRIQSLPVGSQRLLLVAAAEPVGDPDLLWRAARLLGIGADAASPAEAAELIKFGARVRFRHPLVRSAAYRSAALPERQRVHRALADVTDPLADPDRLAWHRALAATGPDEDVAGALERSADRARSRGGIAASAAFLERATEMTPDPARRGARALAAAQVKFEAGAPDEAHRLLTAAELSSLDERQQAQVARLRARIVFARRRGNDAPPLLLDAARRFEGLDGALARETYLEALGAAIFAGRLNGHRGLHEIAVAARAAPKGPQPARPIDLLLEGVATRYTDGFVAGVWPLRQALDAFQREVGRSEDDVMRWLWLAWLNAGDLWDDELWHGLATHAVRLAREAGGLTVLPVALEYRAGVHVHAGEFDAASALVEEADAITEATGSATLRYSDLLVAAWRGDEDRTLDLVETALRDVTARGEGRGIGVCHYSTSILYNGLGRYDAALTEADRACQHEDPGFYGFSLSELVEAGARVGALDAAETALSRLDERNRACGTDWALGILARSHALLEEGQAADTLYREAIERLARTRITIHLARAHLVYGEWLRRQKQRSDAREHLRHAYEMLSKFGASAFAERARRELVATGEKIQKRTAETMDALTAQETQIARLAAEGHTNPEIGSQLFISPRTVEYHLHKVFAKLDVSSRRALRSVLRT